MKHAKKLAPTLPADLDPILAKAVEDAMRPYLDILPASGLETMRDILVDALTTHPVAVDALAEIRRNEPPSGGSGTRVRRDDGDDGDEEGEP